MSHEIKQLWQSSKLYRVLLIATVVYTVLRLVVQGTYLAIMLFPQLEIMGGMPEWVSAQGPIIPNDLQDYLDGATSLKNRQDLYLEGPLDRVEFYQYSPTYALVFTIFLHLPPIIVVAFHTLLHFIAYGLLYVKWGQLFRQLELNHAVQMLAWILPVWLLFSSFWTDLSYLNIYIIMALLATLLIDAVVSERLWSSVLWACIILMIKPQWAFAIAIPLFLRRYGFFLRLLGFTFIVCIGIVGVTLLMVGPAYGWQQYLNYIQFLSDMPNNFPWRGPELPFLGYNHSIKQIFIYVAGISPETLATANIIKILLLIPLGIIGLRYFLGLAHYTDEKLSLISLDWAFALYLGAFIWLDMVWELSLGIAIYPYLLGTTKKRFVKFWVHLAFLPYALLDPLRVLSFIVGGMDVILPGTYIATDPAVYFPLIMLSLLMLYALFIVRLWRSSPAKHLSGV